MNPFESALIFTLKWEGGYSNNPNDSGGSTMRGITQRTYSAYLKRTNQPDADVRTISHRQLRQIYLEEYWTPCLCSMMPNGAAIALFDTSVNLGVGRSVKMIQGVVGANVDGKIGPKTIDAIKSDTQAVTKLLDARVAYYNSIVHISPKNAVFIGGWKNRVSALRQYITVYESHENTSPI